MIALFWLWLALFAPAASCSLERKSGYEALLGVGKPSRDRVEWLRHTSAPAAPSDRAAF